MAMMKRQDLLSCLPQEIITNIFSILSIETITRCKLVCKSWRDLIESPDFELAASSQYHISKYSSYLAVVLDKNPDPYQICAFEDQGRCSRPSSYLLRQNLPTPQKNNVKLLSSCKGLFLVLEFPTSRNLSYNLSICNPITREYVRLPPPRVGPPLSDSTILGFGVSNKSRKYMVVKIFAFDYDYFGRKCEVYTLGSTGSWRYRHIFNLRTRLQLVGHQRNKTGAFASGNLHWLVSDFDDQDRLLIYGFDLETESFIISSAPPLPLPRDGRDFLLSDLEGRLCLCDISLRSETVIWVKKNYGDEKSWIKKLTLRNIALPCYSKYSIFSGYFFPVKVYEDGVLLFAAGSPAQLYCYWKVNVKKIIQVYDWNFQKLRVDGISGVAVYTPNFVSLKSLLLRN